MADAHIWLNGRLVAPRDAVVSVADRGFTSGDGVFEALKVIDGVPFAITRHLQRLARSAAIVGIEPPSSADLRFAVERTIEANRERIGAHARCRITVTAGAGVPGPLRAPSEPTVVITADPTKPHPAAATVITVDWAQNERALTRGAKTTSYAEHLAILERARALGADEALLPDTQGRLCEATTANVLLSFEGRLITPSLATGCLGGVTRELILEWGLAEEFDVPIEATATAEEILITSSTRDIMPAATLDGRRLACPGPRGKAAIKEFKKRTKNNPDP